MLIETVKLEDIISSKYNSRINYTPQSITKMSRSISEHGLLSPVRVRRVSNDPTKYQLLYGHRRVLAARKLGVIEIQAEVVEASDKEMLVQSLIENFDREDLSDYEKGIVFSRLNTEFGKTYDEIGKMVGLSKQHISSYVAMLQLFDASSISSDPELLDTLYHLREHHARILQRIYNNKDRIALAKMTVRENLTVKDMGRIVSRLRGLFPREEINDSPESVDSENLDLKRIQEIVSRDFVSCQKVDFTEYENVHLYHRGFNMYASFPAVECFEDGKALDQEKKWFYEVLPSVKSNVRDLKIKILGSAALATFTVHYLGVQAGHKFNENVRATMVLVKKNNDWKILHEHWSRFEVQARAVKELKQIPAAKNI